MKWLKTMVPKPWRRRFHRLIKRFHPPKKIKTWRLDSIDLTPHSIEIHGWAFVNNMNTHEYSFTVNGHPFENVTYPTSRRDIADILWNVRDSANCGYYCKSPKNNGHFFSPGFATFDFVVKRSGESVLPGNQYYCPDLKKESGYPLPESNRRRRVHGNSSEQPFILEGFTNYMKLENTLQKVRGKNFTDFSSILDWGCGCGRLTRYFRDLTPGTVTGIDIDEDNIKWCRKNMPFGRFESIPLHPPTPLQDKSFDLLIGISIFTHLKEREQFEWLEELHRISTDNALLLMSIHGNEALQWIETTLRQRMTLKNKGIMDVGSNSDLDEVMNCSHYYRNVYHNHQYILRNWSRYFDILDIVPAYIGNIQDLVIMKK